VLKENDEHLDPDGCLVQQRGHRTYEDAAKAAEDRRLIEQKNRVWGYGGQLWQEKLFGEVCFLDKDLFMGTTPIVVLNEQFINL
jgi:hypothetical protein